MFLLAFRNHILVNRVKTSLAFQLVIYASFKLVCCCENSSSDLQNCHSEHATATITSVSNQTAKSPLQFPNSGVFLFSLRKPMPRRSAWMCFLFHPRDKTESVITWRASALNQTLHFFGIESRNDEGEWRAWNGGWATQTRYVSLQVSLNPLWK